MAIFVHKDKCIGCRTCELGCSFYSRGSFCPDNSLIRILFTSDGGLNIKLPNECKCSEEDEPLCIEFCPTNAIERLN